VEFALSREWSEGTDGDVRAIALQSGSNGNCVYVESAGVRLLFDAGISGKKARERLEECGIAMGTVAGVFISHDHADHVCSAGVYQRAHGMPIWATRKTLEAAYVRLGMNGLARVEHFEAGQSVRIGAVEVHTVRTPHDCVDGVAFVVEGEGKRLGILTDLGHVFGGLGEVVGSLDAAFIESNYDVGMLERGRYPAFLKRRIRGQGGHLSNVESAELVRRWGGRLKWACLAHLSQDNNRPDVALATHRKVLGCELRLMVASRHGRTEVLEV